MTSYAEQVAEAAGAQPALTTSPTTNLGPNEEEEVGIASLILHFLSILLFLIIIHREVLNPLAVAQRSSDELRL